MTQLLQSDIANIREAIVRDLKPEDRTTALAAFQIGLELLEKFERITVAFEIIATSMKAIADEPATRFAKDQLKAIIERIERLEEEKKTIPLSPFMQAVVAERFRQIEGEGW